MPHELNNPFRQTTDAKPSLSALGEQFLSPSDVAKLKELELAPRNTKFEIRNTDVSLEDGMSVEERRKSAKEKELREIRENIIKWADEFNLVGEEWVDETFKFDEDGWAVCEKSLKLSKKGITYLPKGIKRVHGNVDLNGNQITKIENLPDTIGGSLDLSHNQITKIENLPDTIGGALHLSHNQITKIENLPDTIGGGLYLYRIPATVMPANINLGGRVFIHNEQTALMFDAARKGYAVETM